MNSASFREEQAVSLVDIVDFKWLMAHEGHHVHVERIQTDRAYAHDCLSMASTSSVQALRDVARRLARKLCA
jgi:hypothetical protein